MLVLVLFCLSCSGNRILDGVTLASPELGPLACPVQPRAAPGESIACTANHTVNATELEAGELTFTATTASTTQGTRGVAAPAKLQMLALPQLEQQLLPGSCQQTAPKTGEGLLLWFSRNLTGCHLVCAPLGLIYVTYIPT